jgi:hypothetical protein
MLSREADEIGPEEVYSEEFDMDDLLRDNNMRESEGLDDWQADFPLAELLPRCVVCGADITGLACDKCVYIPSGRPTVEELLNLFV